MDWFMIVCFVICLIFFFFYFININLFNLLPSSIIINFKQIATQGNPIVSPKEYSINYVSNNYLITENGILFIDTSTSLLNINFAFMSYTYDITNDFATIVPIILGLNLPNFSN